MADVMDGPASSKHPEVLFPILVSTCDSGYACERIKCQGLHAIILHVKINLWYYKPKFKNIIIQQNFVEEKLLQMK